MSQEKGAIYLQTSSVLMSSRVIAVFIKTSLSILILAVLGCFEKQEIVLLFGEYSNECHPLTSIHSR